MCCKNGETVEQTTPKKALLLVKKFGFLTALPRGIYCEIVNSRWASQSSDNKEFWIQPQLIFIPLFWGNPPPTPPLNQHFALSDNKKKFGLGEA